MSHVSRRSLIAGAAAFTLLPSLARAQAGEKKVFLDYTQKQLDDAYDQRVWAPNVQEVLKRQAEASAATRARLKFITESYGPSADEMLDVFPVERPNAPVHVFVHGGAWRAGSKEGVSFLADLFVPAGVIYIAVDFNSIPKARLPEMADKVRRAMAWTYKNAKSFGGDPERIYLSGHSSGGHLAAVLLATDWKAHDVPETVIKAGLCMSGMYDLEAPLLSARSSYVQITADELHALSPQRHLHRIRCPIAITHGDKESPDFQRQARDFAAALAKAGLKNEYAVAPGFNHFEVLETLARPDGLLGRIALKQIGVAA